MTPTPHSLSPAYVRRRDRIRALALDPANPRPRVSYTAEEQAVWSLVWRRLRPLHLRHAASPVLALLDRLGLHDGGIPQLDALSTLLSASSELQLIAVPALTDPRQFFGLLRRRLFPSTQYVRDPDSPFYTPEPDLIHEFVGHAATLLDRRVADLCQAFGQAAEDASPERLQALERVFWFALEYGMVREGNEAKCFGAGLLSSCAEMEHAHQQGAALRTWNPDVMARTRFDSTRIQPQLFVADSFDRIFTSLHAWLATP